MVSAALDSTRRTDADGWVEAAPFRAHLRHLMAVSSMSASCVALLVGISPRLAANLLYGRSGRPLRRISPDTARKLLRVTGADARETRFRTVPAHPTAGHLRQLSAVGWSDEGLAELLGLRADELAGIRAGTLSSCTQLAALRAAAEVALGAGPLPRVSRTREAA